MSIFTAREVLLTISYQKKGRWEEIYSHIKEKKPISKEETLEAFAKTQANFITIVDSEYPNSLKGIFKPPFVLYYYGNPSLLNEPYRLTAVGSRNPTIYQNDTSYRLIKELENSMEKKVVIVSGMAKGIDATMMKAAKDTGSPIISVIASGIDKPYPKENDGIYDYCKEGKGLVLSEYPLDTEAKPQNFLFRNRILAALSPSMFIGAGKKKSGTNNSVYWAMSFGKNILTLPCNQNLDDPELTNELLKQGAEPVLSSNDLKLELLQTGKIEMAGKKHS